MGRLFFGIDIQSEVASAIPPGSMPALSLKKGNTSYLTRGNVGQFTYDQMQQDKSIQRGDQRVILIAKPLDDAGVEPTTGDVIVDDTGKNMTIIKATTNSARAVWLCVCRG